MPKGSTKRKQQLNSTKTKGKNRKKQRRSSASRQQPAEEEKTEEEKTNPQEIKVLKDRLSRRIKNDKMEDLEQYFTSVTNMQCPMRSDVQDIMKRLNEIGSEAKKTADLNPDMQIMVEADLKQKLVQVREAIEKLNEQRKLDLIKAKNLEAIFNNSKVSEDIQREQFFAANLEQTVINGPTTTVGQDQGSLLTREQLQLELQSNFSYLESEVYAMNNNKVDVSDFQGLKEALEKTTWGKTPDHLELIAIRIEKARGKATESSIYAFSEYSFDENPCLQVWHLLSVL